MIAACNFVSLGEKMRELIDKKGIKKEKKRRTEDKRKRTIIDHIGLNKKGVNVSRCAAAFLGEAE